MSDGTPLGSLLIDEGLLTDAQLDAAVVEQARTGKPLGRYEEQLGYAQIQRVFPQFSDGAFVPIPDRAPPARWASSPAASMTIAIRCISGAGIPAGPTGPLATARPDSSPTASIVRESPRRPQPSCI